jgi:hypothetical protein
VICLQCHTALEPAASGRPRRYCSARCRQRAYRLRARVAAQDTDGLVALARHLRDNVDRLWMLAQGWHPPPDEPGPVSIPDLAADTAHVAARLAELDQVRLPKQRNGDETDDEIRMSPSPDRGRNGP